MGMDYRYLLYFERDAVGEVFERLSEMAAPGPEEPTVLELPGGAVELPFSTWPEAKRRVVWSDPMPGLEFATVLCFEPDEPIETYLDRRELKSGGGGEEDERHDERGRCKVGYVYLSVDVGDPAEESGEGLVRFEFGTPGSSMSVLFFESESIRRTFCHLLESSRGVCGVFDMEDWAELFWWRGRRMGERLPTADVTIGEIAAFVAGAQEVLFSFAAEELIASARHLWATSATDELGIHHWLLALVANERPLPDALGRTSAAHVVRELRRRLDGGDAGQILTEAELRRRASLYAKVQERPIVEIDPVVEVISEWASSVELADLADDEV